MFNLYSKVYKLYYYILVTILSALNIKNKLKMGYIEQNLKKVIIFENNNVTYTDLFLLFLLITLSLIIQSYLYRCLVKNSKIRTEVLKTCEMCKKKRKTIIKDEICVCIECADNIDTEIIESDVNK